MTFLYNISIERKNSLEKFFFYVIVEPSKQLPQQLRYIGSQGLWQCAFCVTPWQQLSGFLFTYLYILIIIQMTKEITIDDVIEFIIRNCDNTELMDKINKTSFPFTTKYLNSNNWKTTPDTTTTITIPPYGNWTYTLCGKEK